MGKHEFGKRFPWLKCPDCESKYNYHRAKDDSYLCRKCGCKFRANFTRKRVYRLKREG